MADISKITLPNGSSYDIKDATARSGLAGKAAASHTHNYAGSTSAGGVANKAIELADYKDTNSSVKVGYANASLTADEFLYFAGYTSKDSTGAARIKDVSVDTVKSKLGLKSAAYSETSAFATASHTHTTADQISPISISDGYTIRPFYLNTHPENDGVIVPFINNDIAFLLKRGGSAKIYYDGVEKSVDISAVFDGSGSYWAISPTGITTIVIELSLHRTFAWTNTIYIDFGHSGWRAKNINVSVMNTNNGETSWTSKGTVTNYSIGEYKVTFSHNSGTGFNKIKFTFSNWANASGFRIACLGVLNYDSSGLRETFLPRDGGSLYGGIVPYADNAYDLGSSSHKWRNIYGNLIGNADTVDNKHASDFAAASHKQAFTSSECTSFTSDDNTMGTTPAAVKKAIGMFEPKSHTHTKSQITDFPTIPTKTSQLTNDSGFKTTDNNTTYSLSKSGSTITLTGSDGSKTSVTDTDTNTWRGVQDNLTSTATDQSLSANQGKVLKGLIDGKAAASHGRHVPDTCTTITDWNAATTTGWYMGSNVTNAPSTAWYFGYVIAHTTDYVIQEVYQFTASTDAKAIPKYIRAKVNGTWGAWTEVTVQKKVPSDANFTNTWRGIQNNLTSDSTTDSLSAAQGKALKALVDGKAASSHTHTTQSAEATNDANTSYLRQIASGTAAATTSNCPAGTLYGKY